jgi:hypothetical protein
MRGDALLYESGDGNQQSHQQSPQRQTNKQTKKKQITTTHLGLDSEEVAQYERLASRTLIDAGVHDGTMLTIDDFSQHLNVQLVIQVGFVVCCCRLGFFLCDEFGFC